MDNSTFTDIESIIHKRWKEIGYEGLLTEERDYIVLWWLMAEVNNGGFDQYFFNSSGAGAQRALDALRRVNAHQTATILERAINKLNDFGGFTSNDILRRDIVAEIPGDLFDDVTEEFYNSDEDFLTIIIEDVARAYSVNHIGA